MGLITIPCWMNTIQESGRQGNMDGHGFATSAPGASDHSRVGRGGVFTVYVVRCTLISDETGRTGIPVASATIRARTSFTHLPSSPSQPGSYS